jgi:hypothetical protein
VGSYQYHPQVETNCTNCKRKYRTIHPQFNIFCGSKCEKRWKQRQENGMIPKSQSDGSFYPFTPSPLLMTTKVSG